MSRSKPSALSRLTIKFLIKMSNSLRLTFSIYVSSLFVAAAFFAYFEGRPYGDGLWWAQAASLTIGYGDISPSTTGGRFVGFVFSVFWIFIVAPVIVAAVLTKVLRDMNQFTNLEQEWLLNAVRLIARKLGITLPAEPAATDFAEDSSSDIRS